MFFLEQYDLHFQNVLGKYIINNSLSISTSFILSYLSNTIFFNLVYYPLDFKAFI